MADLFVCRITYDDGTVEETRPLPRCDAERIVDRRVKDGRRVDAYELAPSSQLPLFEVAR